MSDPFSVAGSAVGVASLGISVLQGLINYCTKYRDKDGDVAALSQRCEGLRDIFELLGPRLHTAHHDPAITTLIERLVKACQNSLSSLNDQLQKFQDQHSAASRKTRIRQRAQHLLYPLRQGTLDRLNKNLSELQANLTTALQILQVSVICVL